MERQGGVDTSVDGGGRSSPLASSDNDAVNTSSARVYFGPIQSAEKQRAERVKFGQPTPVRRSARLSSGLLPQSRDVGATGAGQEFAGNDSDQSSGSNTPALAEDLLEEPSSVLAKRILRAWDNPSPPPSPPPQPSSTPTPELDQDDVYAMVADDVERDQNNAKENSEAPREDVYVEEDLITFESFSSSSSAPQMKVMPATPPNPTRSTVDDLLSLSPFQSLPDSQTLHAISIGEEVARESTPSVADEAEVAFTLSNPSDPATSSPIIPAAEATYLCEPEAHIPLVVLTPTPQPEPHTPLRRSTRPRRSVSPFITPLTGLPSKLDLTPSNIVSSTPNTSATRVRKAKAKDADIVKPDNRQEPLNQANAAAATTSLRPPASIIDELLEELNNDIIAQVEVEDNSMVANPKSFSSGAGKPSTPNVKRATHRLGSLSPTSNNMLMQLLPSPGKSPAPVVDDMIGPSPGLETSPSMPASSGQHPRNPQHRSELSI
ncbi:hypothetical protein BC835DRAFT_526322 [Cytidiella melzeri]|nr:hypothetical protein BC835DRAFT_526322 [Cytidiella melzeri]